MVPAAFVFAGSCVLPDEVEAGGLLLAELPVLLPEHPARASANEIESGNNTEAAFFNMDHLPLSYPG
ncbi:hypothetical protein [Paenibacillus cymbidii]|uniref:hypothetical protein n=1 Tax=Paenibacillus cymbidii TaxID=1639034 RepID=UPI001436CAB6|nr:hypothetical protein [Paenibacillus cymbidii]